MYQIHLRNANEKESGQKKCNMAILESCCGCSLAVSSAVLGVYLLVAYAIAFAIELWWTIESPATPPIPACLLCLGYLILLTFSALLLHGLSVKKTTFLLIWLFMMGILLGPEAGLVLYLSIHYWKVTSLYGLIELTCWACRLVVNAVGLLSVQSLYSTWREEKSVLLRLENLKTSPLAKYQGRLLGMNSIPVNKYIGCEKKDFKRLEVRQKERSETGGSDFYAHFRPSDKGMDSKEGDYDSNYSEAHYAAGLELSEFSASSFDPTIIDARLENMPYLTIRKKPPQGFKAAESVVSGNPVIAKTRSLLDFRDIELPNADEIEQPNKPNPYFPIHSKNNLENNTNSLDRKIIKNKNLKILKRLSPFYSRKPSEVNIYQINPPRGLHASVLDSKLNEVYCHRGKYAFDDKLKKVVYYPPEFFKKNAKFRNRMDSYGSSQSRSSGDTDSEDLRHISDVAL